MGKNEGKNEEAQTLCLIQNIYTVTFKNGFSTEETLSLFIEN